MELKDFVSKTLLAICEGIKDAQEQGKEHKLIIAPPVTESGNVQSIKESTQQAQVVHFNLKIAVESSTEKGSGGSSFSLQIANIGFSKKLGEAKNASGSNALTQEISFDIPVLWPSNYKQIDPEPISHQHNCYDPFRDRY